MTDEQAGSNTALYVRKRLGAYRKRRVQECILILASAYIDVLSKLNNDVSEAFRLFDEFTKTAAKGQVPTRRRGKARPELDARILAAGDAAPPRKREAAVAVAAEAKPRGKWTPRGNDTTDSGPNVMHMKNGSPRWSPRGCINYGGHRRSPSSKAQYRHLPRVL